MLVGLGVLVERRLSLTVIVYRGIYVSVINGVKFKYE